MNFAPAHRYFIYVNDQQSHLSILEVGIYTNSRQERYGLFEVTLTNFPETNGHHASLLRCQLDHQKISGEKIPAGETDVEEWIRSLAKQAYGQKTEVIIRRK